MTVGPGLYNLTIYRRATFNIMLRYTDADGLPYNLTGYTALFIIKDTQQQDELLRLTEIDGIALGGTFGTVEITIPVADTTAIEPEEALYSLTIAKNGAVIPLLIGRVAMSNEVFA